MLLAALTFLLSHAEARPYSFGECVDILYRSHPELIAAESNLRSQENLTRGTYAGFFPSLNATAGWNRTSPQGLYDPRYSSGLQLSYNLFSGLRDRGRSAQGEASLALARANYDAAKAKASYALRQAFAQYLFTRENIELTSKIRERRFQNERLVRAQYENGRENIGSHLLSKSLLELAEYEARVAKDQLMIASQNLAHVLGVDSLEFEASGEVPLTEPPAQAKAEELLLNTPAHRIQDAKVRISETASQVSLSGLFPSLDLSGSIGFFGPEPTWSQNRNTAWGLTLTVPLFSGLNTWHEYRSSLQVIRASEQARVFNDFEILTQLRQNLLTYQQAIQKLRVDTEILNAATIRATIARKRYNNGLLMFEQWDVIETDLINRQKTQLASRRDRILAESNYRQTLGLGDSP
jgi:outer membrane protein